MIVMSLASFATDVPSPIDSPTCAALRAGASFVPSPVTATTSPCCCSSPTSLDLSVGRARDIIFMRRAASAASLSSRAAKSGPVIMLLSLSVLSFHSPICRPISFAVPGVSPVTILILIPASMLSFTAAGTSARTGSEIATMPINVRLSALSESPSTALPSPTSWYANPRVRIAFCWYPSRASRNCSFVTPSGKLRHLSITISGAPFT